MFFALKFKKKKKSTKQHNFQKNYNSYFSSEQINKE